MAPSRLVPTPPIVRRTPPPPAPSPARERDRNLLEIALTEKGLPAGKIGYAVAGYLYFPQPPSKGGKNSGYELIWTGGDQPLPLAIPAPQNS